MIMWQAIADAGYALPAGHDLDDLVHGLSRALADPDPEVRDGAAYAVLATWIDRGVIDAPRRRALGDAMAARFGHPEVQARTFAPLVLVMLVDKGEFAAGWVDAFAAWYLAEDDLRGWDERLGWLHAVAHGADLLGAFGQRPEVAPGRMPALAAGRLLARTEHVLDQLEDDRLARGLVRALSRPDAGEGDTTDWLLPVGAALRGVERGRPAPAWLSNTLRTLRALYVLVDRDGSGLPHGPLLRARLGGVLAAFDAR